LIFLGIEHQGCVGCIINRASCKNGLFAQPLRYA
jgi:hypothetical protein